MEKTIKTGGITAIAVAIAVALVAIGLVGGLAISGGLSPNNQQAAPVVSDSAAQNAAPYAYGPGMMGSQQGYGLRRGGAVMGGQPDFGPGRGFRGGSGQYGYGPGMMADEFGYGPRRGYGSGMMADEFSYGRGRGYGPGMMADEFGYGPRRGYGPGMMGGFAPGGGMGWFVPDEALVPAPGETLSLEQAVEVAEAYLAAFDDEDLELAEVMQFSNHFYAQAREESTGIYAFEFLIDPLTSAVHHEPGPNVMWNAKYGHMGSVAGTTGEMAVSPAEAAELAQAYLDDALPGTTADEEADAFYGYYTLHVLRDGEIAGMLSVNGTTGQVWLHTWHGDFVDMMGHDHE